MGYNLQAVSDWLHVRVIVPDRNGDRATGELSRSDELLNIFLKRSRWLEPLHESIMYAGKHFCYSAPSEKNLILKYLS